MVGRGGRLDVLYQGNGLTNRRKLTLGHAYSYFTSSRDRGRSWSAPLKVGAQAGTMATGDWWIDGDIAIDTGGTLYASWDTQGEDNRGHPHDIGWLSFSPNGGRTWSVPVQAPSDRSHTPHIIEVAGGPAGRAYVGWLSTSDRRGWALYLRTFSTARGWLDQPVRISRKFGRPLVWPGDTFGISILSPQRLVLS